MAPPQNTRVVPLCGWLLLACIVLPESPAIALDSARPNFIVILVDDMGYAGVSCFGNPYFRTPHIDRLADEGMRLTDFHSNGTLCSPTRAALLTGRYQQRAGIEAVIHPAGDHAEHRKGLQLGEITIAELLRDAGYATGLVGKWHQGYVHNSADYHPQNHGFDEFIGYHSGNVDYVSHVGDHGEHDWWHGRTESREEGYVTDLVNRHAVEFIERHHEDPFFLYVAHLAIHNPLQGRGDPVRRAEGGMLTDWKPANDDERIEKFRQMTLPVDEGVGQILAALARLGIDRRTLVLFCSDNGASAELPSGDPRWRAGKGAVYEGGHKVPCIAWWPGCIPPGTTSDVPAMTMDILPTLIALAGVSPLPEHVLDGVDLSPVLLHQQSLPPRPLYWASMANNGSRTEAIRVGEWKLVVRHPRAEPGTFENERVELYRLAVDPAEQHDLAREEPARAAEMLAQLKAWYAETTASAADQPGGW